MKELLPDELRSNYKLAPDSLRKKQNSRKYRDPDRLNSAKQELKSLVREYYPGTHSKAIAPHLSLDNNKSQSFQIFIQGLSKLLKD